MATDFLFQAGSHDETELNVLRFSGSERMSQPFWYEVTLSGKDVTVDFEDIIGSDACLKLATPEGERFVHGIVSRWEEAGAGRHGTTYEATIVPRVWPLSLRRDSWIFQNLTTQEIVKDVLENGGMKANDHFRFSLQGSYKPRTYCVQYRETDLEFVSRLLEEEGMFYFFEQTEDGHVMVIADSNDACVPIPGTDVLPFKEGDPGMLGTEQELVKQFHTARSLRVSSVSMLEFDFKKPSLDQTVTEKASDAKKETLFITEEFPGEYHEPGLGKRLAKVRLEEQRAETYLAVGETDCRRLSPGWRFTLEGHGTDSLNQEYLVVAARHRGVSPRQDSEGGDVKVYRCSFECTPVATAYRPPRVTPRPRLDGLQTAMVVGPSGEEIHCDEFGRVKVKFPWDRAAITDDKASCWIRVSQQWGGGGFGSVFIPRIGQEVIVEFLEGDPDRPLITGRIYNGASPVPYELPAQKILTTMQSSTTPGGRAANEFRMNDTKGSEEIFVNASKDHNSAIENNRHMKVRASETVTVSGNVTRDVGGNEGVTVDGNRIEVVNKDQTLDIKGNHDVGIDGSRERQIGVVRLGLIKGDSKLESDGVGGHTVGIVLVELVKGDSKREISGNTRMKADAVNLELIKGDHKEESEENDHKVLVGGLILKKTKGDHERESEGMYVITAPTLNMKAENIEIEAKEKFALAVGGSFIVMTSSEITIESSDITLKASGALEEKGATMPWN